LKDNHISDDKIARHVVNKRNKIIDKDLSRLIEQHIHIVKCQACTDKLRRVEQSLYNVVHIAENNSDEMQEVCSNVYLITDYLSNKLTGKNRWNLLAHLAECSECRGVYAAMAKAKYQLREDFDMRMEPIKFAFPAFVNGRIKMAHAPNAVYRSSHETYIAKKSTLVNLHRINLSLNISISADIEMANYTLEIEPIEKPDYNVLYEIYDSNKEKIMESYTNGKIVCVLNENNCLITIDSMTVVPVEIENE